MDFKNFHITLKFLGDTPEKIIPDIDRILKNISKKFSVFSLQLKGAGVFKNIANPRVLWIGLENSEDLKSLFNEIDNELNRIGFKKESREFNPHLTIARIKFLKDKKLLLKAIIDNCDKKWNQITVKEFILFESILKKDGPVYKKLARYEL